MARTRGCWTTDGPLVEHVLELSPQVDEIVISANRNLDRYRELRLPHGGGRSTG